jgi:capsular exopolysaccharide synthesis family protein
MADSSLIRKSELFKQPPVSRSEGLDLHALLGAFRRRRRVIIYSIVICVLVAATVCIFMTPRYDAINMLNINPQGGSSIDLGNLTDLMSGSGGLDWDAVVQTQVLIVSSDPLAWDTIRTLRLDQDPTFMRPGLLNAISKCKMIVTPPNQSPDGIPPCRRFKMLSRFSKALEVQALPKSQAVQIRFRSEDPALAAKVVNQLTSAYLHYNFTTRYNATMQASGWLQDRLNEMRQNMENAQSNLTSYQKSAGIIGTDETDNLAIDQLTDMGKQLTEAEADRIVKEANYRLAMTGNPELIGTIVPDSVLPTLRSQEAQLNVSLAEAKAEFGPRYPKVIQLQSQIAEVQRSLTTEISNIQARFKSEFESAQHSQEKLHDSVDRLKQEAFSESAKFNRYDLLRNEVTSTQDLYDDLLKKLNEAGVTAGLRSTNVDVIAPAEAPIKPTLPNVPMFLFAGIASGLVIGVMCVFILENLDHSIRGFEDMQLITSLPVVGVLPHVSFNGPHNAGELNGNGGISKNLCSARSEFSEATRILRTSLLLAAPGKPPKVIMMTSALPAEGKSMVSLNLAATLARSARRVLLVEADLRRGSLVQGNAASRGLGLSGCLTGQANWQDQIQQIPLEDGQLFVLPAGPHPPNPAELLGSQQMINLLQTLRLEFDHIVIDTAPVAVVTDAVVLSPLADVLLIVARINRTTRFALEHTHRTLARATDHIAGVVLNDDNVAERYYGYGDHHKYYSYYASPDASGDISDGEGKASHSLAGSKK